MEDFSSFDYVVNPPVQDKPENSLFQTYNVVPTTPSLYPSLSDVGDALAFPFKAASGAAKTVVSTVTGTVRNTYLYLVGGIVIIGILGIVLLGAGTRFMGKVQS